MLKWIQSYIFNRRARVSLDQLSSRKILLRQRVLRGGVLSPTLFLVLINDLVKLQKDYPAVLTISTLPLSKQDLTNPCESTTSDIQINTTILQLDQ